jgi:Leucine-rich repeat (LRR) protein
MDHLTALPTALLVNIHGRLNDTSCLQHEQRRSCTRAVRTILALEATCKELRRVLYEHTRITLLTVSQRKAQKPEFWRWLARHGRRIDLFDLTACEHDSLPVLCHADGVLAVKAVHATVKGANTLHALEGLPNLTSLLWEPTSTPWSEPIAGLTALEELTLSRHFNTATLARLADLPRLTKLEILSCFDMDSLASLSSGATRLRHLKLGHLFSVTTLEPLKSLTSITHLHLHRCCLATLNQLHALVSLQYLNLEDMYTEGAASDLHFLTALTQLQALCLITDDTEAITIDLQPLTALRGSLKELHLQTCQATSDLAPIISTLSSLTRLILMNSHPLADGLRFLTPLTLLRELHVTAVSQVSSIEPIAALTALRSLRLGNVAAPTLAPLGSLASLHSLHLSRCSAVSSLEPLAPLASLQRLHIGNCPCITSLGPLAPPAAARRLQVSGSPHLLAAARNARC